MISILLGIPRPDVLFVVAFIRRVVDLIQHSDLPWDYGLAGYVLVSPRYHRIHHSNKTEDYNSNYGDIFSFWDYLFGTTSLRYRHSPLTADTCNLGLTNEKETHELNRWETILFNETIYQYVWTTIRNFSNLKKA